MRTQLLSALHTRFDTVVRTGDATEVFTDRAAAEIEQLLDFLTNDEGLDVEVLYTLGLVHWLRAVTAEDVGRTADRQLDEARAGVFLLPLYLRQPDGLPDAVRASLAAATGQPEATPEERKTDIAEALSNLAMLLLGRFASVGGTDGPAAVGLLRQALFDLPYHHPSYPVVLSNLAYALLITDVVPRITDSTTQHAEPPRVDELIALFRAALHGTPPGHENYVRCVNGLGQGLRAKAILGEDLAVLAEAIDCFRTAVAVPTVPADNEAQILTDLGTSLLMWGTHTDDAEPAVLDEARTALHRALRLTPEGSDELDTRLTNLAKAVHVQGDDIAALRGMLADPAAVPVERALLHGILGEALLVGETGREPSARVDEAVTVLRAAVEGLPPGTEAHRSAGAALERALMYQTPFQANRMRRQEMVGDLLGDMFGESGSGEPNIMSLVGRMLGMDAPGGDSRHGQMMGFARQVLSYPSGAGMADVMASSMRILGQQMEHLDPEERARAVERLLSSDSRPTKPTLLWDPESLAEIDALYQRLDEELPADHEDRRLLGPSRAQLRMVRVMHADEPVSEARLDSMAAMLGEMRQTLPAMMESLGEAGEMMDSLTVMGSALMSPFDSLAVVDDAIRRYRAGGDDVEAATALAHSLFERYTLTSDEADYQEAAALTRSITAETPLADPQLVLHWGNVAVRRSRQNGMTGQPPPTDGGSTTLARVNSNHAADLLDAFDGPGALETLEDGRASMLSHALTRRYEVDGLRRIDPALADEFVALRDEIAANVNPGRERRPGAIEEFRERARRWDALVTRIKTLPGFDRFLWPLPLGLADLRPAGAEGPVVTINVNQRRCDALLLGPDGLRVVPLPDLHEAELVDQVDAFRAAVAAAAAGGPMAAHADRVVVDTLAWLWRVVAEPVLAAAGCTATPEPGRPWPRLWWSPTGPLNFLPLHAAGRHDVPGESVIDRVVSSYTPTLRALMLSRSHPVSAHRTAFAVAMPETPGYADLPATVREVAALTADVPTAPTARAVLAALPGAAVAHFACHAVADPDEPAASHLVLADGSLRISDIGRLHLRDAELAYLSACATARGGDRLADEAIHVASAFQLAGYAQVVGTLWEVEDTVAAEIAAEFYADLATAMTAPDRLPAAAALHRVTRRQRDRYRDEPTLWAAHLHAGA